MTPTARALAQPGAIKRASGLIKFQCPACAADGHDKHQDNAALFPDGRWGCAYAPRDRAHYVAIRDVLGVNGARPLPPLVTPLMPQECVVRTMAESTWAVWPQRNVIFDFSRFHDAKDTYTAECRVSRENGDTLHWARLNLMSTQARTALAKALEAVCPDTTPWTAVVDRSCYEVVQHVRRGSVAIALTPRAPTTARWWLEGWMPRGETTVLFGDGGTGKSLLALAVVVAGLSGGTCGLWRPMPSRRVLYLDWESDAIDHEERLWQLGGQPDQVLHRRFARPLTDVLDLIRSDVEKYGVDVVVCDSLGAACGPEPEGADAAVRTLMGLRVLEGTTRLVLAHVSKAGVEERKARPFGSVYVQNLARSVIEARGESHDEAPQLTVSLYHRKSNYGRLARAMGLAFHWEADNHITIGDHSPDLTRVSVEHRVLASLPVEPASKTVTELSEELGCPEGTLRPTLTDLEKRCKVINLATVSGGRGHKAQWARPLTQPLNRYRDNG